MQYKIVVICHESETANKVYNLLIKSEIYNSQEIIHVIRPKEVCDECANKS